MAWAAAGGPAGANLTHVAVSADGKHGWAVGYGPQLMAYRLAGGVWTAQPGALPDPLNPVRITADDNGNGWLLGDMVIQADSPTWLVRLTPGGAPQETAISSPVPGRGLVVQIHIAELAVAANGQGWAVGSVLGTGGADAVVMRIDGDSVLALPPEDVTLPADFAPPILVVSISPNGQYTWVGNQAGQLAPLTVTTASPGMPRTGGQQGAGLVGGLLALALLAVVAGLRVRRSWLPQAP
jgi:hypothetical protein